MRTLLATILFLSAATAAATTITTSPFSNDTSILGRPNPIPNPGHPPEPIDTKPHLPFWRDLWDHGTNVSPNLLTGGWKMVGMATNAECGYLLKDSFDDKGIKNRDGSIQALAFKDYPAPPPTKGATMFGVELLNLGKKSSHQGPFKVEMTEPQFSQWGYSSVGTVSSHSYWEYRCRMIQTTGLTGVACMLTSVLREPPPGTVWDINSIRCSRTTNGVALIYTR